MGGGLNEVIVRHFLKQLASALEFLRTRNYIHRDVKPQNLLLDPSPLFYAQAKPEAVPYAAHDRSLIPIVGVVSMPTLKIADFGFARSLPSTSLAETLCGSPLYMAPEILRYEKYDAKADLWSVGTVLYEMMTGKPPFRASNHVELLRRIERGEDRIRFPEDAVVTDHMKKLIRSLLKRAPVERMGFRDFFNHTVVKDEIPGLVGDDRRIELPQPEPGPETPIEETTSHPETALKNDPAIEAPAAASRDATGPTHPGLRDPPAIETRLDSQLKRRSSGTPPRSAAAPLRGPGHRHDSSAPSALDSRERGVQARRPSIVSHATAPARPDLHATGSKKAATAMQRQPSRNTPSPSALGGTDKPQQRDRISKRKDDNTTREAREARERAAQDVAFERDYVLVEKRAVEVNAFADELAASPRIQGSAQNQSDAHRGAMVRRATTQGSPSSAAGAQVTPSRAMQLASGKRTDQMHYRQSSYERRLRDPTATSAISKALTMAGGRLLNMGWSPPRVIGRGPSPPAYSPFPAYPSNQGSIIMIGDGSKGSMPADEDSRAVQVIEESATRSDVVYGFAEVKYKQLIPLTPSMDQGLGLRQAGIPEGAEVEGSGTDDDGLTIDAVVTLSEEALVLYVKALSLLARSMDIAGAWWARKNRGEIMESTSPRTVPTTSNNVAVGNRVNNVVQWVRSRFNEVLEKAEFVRSKLVESQKQLPPDHPSHPNNLPSASSSLGMGTSADNVIVTSGVTAEKLMYDRALEMSRSAAVNELVGDDLPGCEIAYVTAMRMLEAVLEDDDDSTPKRPIMAEKDAKGSISEDDAVNGVEAEDRKVVLKLVHSIRSRLVALRKKMQILAKRTSTVHASALPSKPPAAGVTSAPAIANSPPR